MRGLGVLTIDAAGDVSQTSRRETAMTAKPIMRNGKDRERSDNIACICSRPTTQLGPDATEWYFRHPKQSHLWVAHTSNARQRQALPRQCCPRFALIQLLPGCDCVEIMATAKTDGTPKSMAALWSLKGGKASLAEYLRRSNELMPAVPSVEVRCRNWLGCGWLCRAQLGMRHHGCSQFR